MSFAHRRDTRIKEWSLVHGGFVVSAFENPNTGTELFISDFLNNWSFESRLHLFAALSSRVIDLRSSP